MNIPAFFGAFAAKITGKPLIGQLADIDRIEREEAERATIPMLALTLSDMATPARKALMRDVMRAKARRHTQAIHKHRAALAALALSELKER